MEEGARSIASIVVFLRLSDDRGLSRLDFDVEVAETCDSGEEVCEGWVNNDRTPLWRDFHLAPAPADDPVLLTRFLLVSACRGLIPDVTSTSSTRFIGEKRLFLSGWI